MPKSNRYEDEGEDEDEDNEDEFDFMKNFEDLGKFFSDPNKSFIDPSKLFSSKQFRQLFKEIFEKLSKNLPPEFQNLSPEDLMREFKKNKGKFGVDFPIMYGFNVGIGSDGKPTIDSFGNIKSKPYSGKPVVKSKREPLTEVIEEQDEIIVIAEMPGVDRDDIELEATSHRKLTISTKENANRSYYKEVEFASAVNSDVAKARYTNGILEVRLKKIDEKHKRIQIE
ncbi:MAG: archaeal heat shock protein Hsp20 [Promethearchaeota archaeon]|jgi:HSP20 family protein